MFRSRSFSPQDDDHNSYRQYRDEKSSRRRGHRTRSRSPRGKYYSERNRSSRTASSLARSIDRHHGGRNRPKINIPQMRIAQAYDLNYRYKKHGKKESRSRSRSSCSSRFSGSGYASSYSSENCTVPDCTKCIPKKIVPPNKKEINDKMVFHIVQNLVAAAEEGEGVNTAESQQAAAPNKTHAPETVEKPLEEEVLNFLGDRISTERKYDDPVREDLALRITDIVTLGLKNEELKSLTESYCPPSNCKLIDPPKVNIEAMCKDATSKERDKRIIKTQLKNSAALAATQKGLTVLLNQNKTFEEILAKINNTHAIYGEVEKLKDDRIAMVEHFSKAARLSADVQHEHSMVRRGLLLGNMNHYSESVKEAIKSESKIDEFLFGSNLGDIIKAAKTNEGLRNKDTKSKNIYSKNFKNPLRGNYHQQAPGSGGRHTMNTPSTSNKSNQGHQRFDNQQHRSNKDKYRRRSKKF